MTKRIWAALAVGGLLVGAGLVTSVVSAPQTADAQEGSNQTDRKEPGGRLLGLLEEVLDGLVGDGTIDQAQADAIISATEARAEEMRQQHQAIRDQIEEMLEDGVITEEEAADLPEDHPLLGERFDEAWADGELSREELQALRHESRPGFSGGFRLGSLLDDGGIDAQELEDLPDDHPLKQADTSEFLQDDGVISRDELRELLANRWGEGA